MQQTCPLKLILSLDLKILDVYTHGLGCEKSIGMTIALALIWQPKFWSSKPLFQTIGAICTFRVLDSSAFLFDG